MARILVAEDEPPVREFVSRALESHGHDVDAVGDGAQALTALENNAYDLVLSDIAMPVMDGIALALRVTRDWPDLPVVLMTGYADQRARAHNLDALVHDVVSKPFTLEEICAVVETTLNTSGASSTT